MSPPRAKDASVSSDEGGLLLLLLFLLLVASGSDRLSLAAFFEDLPPGSADYGAEMELLGAAEVFQGQAAVVATIVGRGRRGR